MNTARTLQLAGLLTEAKKPKMDADMDVAPDVDMDADDAAQKSKKAPKSDASADEDKPDYPAVVLSACKKLGKDLVSTEDDKKMFADDEALCEYLMKVYNAGMKAK